VEVDRVGYLDLDRFGEWIVGRFVDDFFVRRSSWFVDRRSTVWRSCLLTPVSCLLSPVSRLLTSPLTAGTEQYLPAA
jgi:hypothetical protein